MNKLDLKDLSDLDVNDLQDGFSIIFDDETPVAAIASYEYYRYLSDLINKVKEYVAQQPK